MPTTTSEMRHSQGLNTGKQASHSGTNGTDKSVIYWITSDILPGRTRQPKVSFSKKQACVSSTNKTAKRVDFSETYMSSRARQTRQPKAVLDAENRVLQSETANHVDCFGACPPQLLPYRIQKQPIVYNSDNQAFNSDTSTTAETLNFWWTRLAESETNKTTESVAFSRTSVIEQNKQHNQKSQILFSMSFTAKQTRQPIVSNLWE